MSESAATATSTASRSAPSSSTITFSLPPASPGASRPRSRPMCAPRTPSTPAIRTCSATAPRGGRPMRVFAFVFAISVLVSPFVAGAAPARVASLNLCTDELLLALAAPDQIVSVTHLAQNPAETPLWRQARRYRRNDGSLLSVAPLRPDLVVTMGGGARDRLRIAARLGMRTLDLPFAQSLDDVEASINRLAGALGRPAAGAALIGRIRALRASAPPPRIDAIWLGGGGRTVAPTGLEAQW